MNRPGYEYIRTRGLYNTEDSLSARRDTTIEFPVQQGGQSQVAIIAQTERSRYHTLTVKLATH